MNRHRLRIFVWFLSRPSLYKQLMREIISFVKRKEHPTLSYSEEAVSWCIKSACDEEKALLRIDPSWNFLDFNQEFPKLVKDGFKVIESFNFNWGGQGNISLNYCLAKHLQAERILETGVAYGWSSLSILAYLNRMNRGSLVSIDMPFWGTQHEDKIGCVVPSSLRDRWKLIRLPDRDAIPALLKKNLSFDLCHYDSDKSYQGKIWALPRLWSTLREKGILVCDDINDNLAFKHFCESEMIDPIIVKTYDSQVQKFVGIALKN